MRGKKMASTVIAAVIGLSFVCSAFAKGGYYAELERRTIPPDALVYRAIEPDKADELIISLTSVIGASGNEAEVYEKCSELYDLYNSAYDSYSLALLQVDCEYTEENRKILIEAADNSLTVMQLWNKAIELIYNSDYRYILNDMFGEDIVNAYVENMPGERFYELKKQEEELVSKYDGMYNDSDACAKLYIKLVGIRNEMAREEGYRNYAEYANEMIYYRDYSDEQIQSFSENVITYCKPLMQTLMWADDIYTSEPVVMSEADVIANVGSLFAGINSELEETYLYMLRNNLYDISYSEKKSQSGGAYTMFINSIKAPFIFISPQAEYESNGTEPLKTLIHESGHYAALLNDPANTENSYKFEYAMKIDTAETHSQGLEMLTLPYYGILFGSSATDEKYSQLTYTVAAIVEGLLFHEFQTRVYESENLTVDKANEIMQELLAKYYDAEFEPEDAQAMWTVVPHNFHSPMYYISYAVSGAAALSILADSVEDYDSALDKYMHLSAAGVYMPFMEAMELCGIDNVFSEETTKDTIYAICREYGFLYDDIDYEAWYAEHIFYLSDIFDGRTETEFEPESNITRGEFVEVIGKMYDYYVGDDMNYRVAFKDVDESDESAKYIAWANKNGIIEGYSDTEFGTGDAITREQLVAVLYRLAQYEAKADVTVSDKLKSFADHNTIAQWAELPMAWAVDTEIINGRDNNMIVPQGNTTRAEASKIIACYIQNAY